MIDLNRWLLHLYRSLTFASNLCFLIFECEDDHGKPLAMEGGDVSAQDMLHPRRCSPGGRPCLSNMHATPSLRQVVALGEFVRTKIDF